MKSFVLQAHAANTNALGWRTRFIPFGSGGSLGDKASDPGTRLPVAGTVGDLFCYVKTNSSVGTGVTFTLQKNGVDTGATIFIPTNAGYTGIVKGTGSASFSKDDKIRWKVSGATGNSIVVTMLGASITADSSGDTITTMTSSASVASTLYANPAFGKPTGTLGFGASEASYDLTCPISGTVSHLGLYTIDTVNSSEAHVRIAGISSAVTVPWSSTDSYSGLYDITHSAGITAGQKLALRIANSAGSGYNLIGQTSLSIVSSNGEFFLLCADSNSEPQGKETTLYYPIGGILNGGSSATEALVQYEVPFDCTVTKTLMHVVSATTQDQLTKLHLRRNGVTVGADLQVPANSGDAYYLQPQAVDFAAGDKISFALETGASSSSGSLAFAYIGLVAKEAASGAALVVGGLSQAQSLGGATLTQKHSLAPAGLSQTQTIGSAALTQAHVLYVDNVAQVSALENVLLTQAHSLAVSSLQQIQSIDGVTLTQAHALAVARIDQAQAIGNAALIQAHQLVVDAIDQAQSIDGVTLAQAGSLDVQDAGQTQSLGSVTLTQAHVIAVAGIAQQQAIDQAALTQAHSLSVDGVSQAQSIESISLAVAGSLAAHDIAQGQTLSGITLTQAGVLRVDDASQAQSIDTATLTQHYALAVQGLLQNTTISNVTLTEGSLALVVGDINQTQTIDQPALTAHSVLSVDDMTQSQILATVLLGGTVIGSLDGELVMYALMDGEVVTRTLLSADVAINTIH